jgi:hypothetical protein
MSLIWTGEHGEYPGLFWIILLLFVLLGGFMGVVYTDRIKRIAHAFAVAEGYYTPGTVPNRYNNPGDLKLGDKGSGVYQGKTIFASAEAGWNALYKQVALMVTGLSHYYKPSMTLREVAKIYTGEDAAQTWAEHAAKDLGVSADTKLSEIV